MADKYYRLICFVTNVCTEPIRALFEKLAQSDLARNFQLKDIQSYLRQRQRDIDHLKSTNIIRDDQYDLLFPKSGSTDILNWDITLLITLIKNLFKGQLQPLDNFTLDDIRNIRNRIQHMSNTSNMPDDKFNDYWDRLKSDTMCIAKRVSGKTFEKEIEEKINKVCIKNMPELGDALRIFYEENLKQMKEELRKITQEMSEMKTTMNKMKENGEETNNEIKSQKRTLACLKTKTNRTAANSNKSFELLQNVTETNVGPTGETVKRLKTSDKILSKMKRNFQTTMSKLQDDFVTDANIESIIDKLKTQHHVIVSGYPGSRYIETALYAAKKMDYETNRCAEMTDALEWHHINAEDVDFVLCTSPFGKHAYDTDKAKNMYSKFDRILHAVNPNASEKHIDFLLVTDTESLAEFETTTDHELLRTVVKIFAPTSVTNPEDLTENCGQLNWKLNVREVNLPRQITDMYFAQRSSQIDDWEETTLKSAKEKLKKHKFLVISGPPCSGKTSFAVHLASLYQPEAVLVLSFLNDVEKVNFQTTSLVIIDDFVGKYGFEKLEVCKWFRIFDILYKVVHAGKLNVIIVCDTENLNRCRAEIAPHPILSQIEILAERSPRVKQELISEAGSVSDDAEDISDSEYETLKQGSVSDDAEDISDSEYETLQQGSVSDDEEDIPDLELGTLLQGSVSDDQQYISDLEYKVLQEAHVETLSANSRGKRLEFKGSVSDDEEDIPDLELGTLLQAHVETLSANSRGKRLEFKGSVSDDAEDKPDSEYETLQQALVETLSAISRWKRSEFKDSESDVAEDWSDLEPLASVLLSLCVDLQGEEILKT